MAILTRLLLVFIDDDDVGEVACGRLRDDSLQIETATVLRHRVWQTVAQLVAELLRSLYKNTNYAKSYTREHDV